MIKLYPILLGLILTSCSYCDGNNQVDSLENKVIDCTAIGNFQGDTFSAAQIPFTDSVLSFSTGTFPESWDANHVLRSHGEKVLIWMHCADDHSRGYKKCVVINAFLDSLNIQNYCISMEYSTEKPFNEWHTGIISYAPDSVGQWGYSDLLLECYDHTPSKEEIDKLLYRFKFEFATPGYLTPEAGIDVKLWKSIFGYYPTNLLPPNS